ncbi:unnamed protein product [Periconia digitata]|uniref:EKC/KEOPS complex subunit GON7 n=1 Tax=Periconia digitata TaxID=1303443 RepID=A0A9W4U2X4_9PLEO|nr:unnamed protein product [Periconia digitata]
MPDLKATYTSLPTTTSPHTKTFTHALPPLDPVTASSSPDDRTVSLAALQNNLKNLQADINTFLTAKMAEDKAAADANAVGASAAKRKRGGNNADDDELERNYGEDVGDEA